MKRKILLVFVLLICFCLTSCLDYVQTISYQNGKYHFYYKFTVSKLLMELADEDVDDFIENINTEFISAMPNYFSVKPVNTELEAGVEIAFDINPSVATDEQKQLLPKRAGNKYYLPFLIANEISDLDDFSSLDSDDQGIAMAMMSTAKFRIMVSKNIVPSIDIAYFKGIGNENVFIPSFDYGNSYCLEIPYMVLFETSMYNFEQIVIISEK